MIVTFEILVASAIFLTVINAEIQFLYMVDSFMMGYAGFIYLRAWHNSCVYLAAAGGGEASRTKAL